MDTVTYIVFDAEYRPHWVTESTSAMWSRVSEYHQSVAEKNRAIEEVMQAFTNARTYFSSWDFKQAEELRMEKELSYEDVQTTEPEAKAWLKEIFRQEALEWLAMARHPALCSKTYLRFTEECLAEGGLTYADIGIPEAYLAELRQQN